MHGNVLKWIENRLCNGKQRVVLNSKSSDWRQVLTVLGSLLFVVYINDIDDSVASKVLKFADDTKIYGIVNTAFNIDSMRSDLCNHFFVVRRMANALQYRQVQSHALRCQ